MAIVNFWISVFTKDILLRMEFYCNGVEWGVRGYKNRFPGEQRFSFQRSADERQLQKTGICGLVVRTGGETLPSRTCLPAHSPLPPYPQPWTPNKLRTSSRSYFGTKWSASVTVLS